MTLSGQKNNLFNISKNMAISFPTSLDALTNPNTTDKQNNPSHAAQHANANDAIEALEAKVGIDSSAVTTSHDYMIAKLKMFSALIGTRDRTAANGSVNYAHGLGVIPRLVKITAFTDGGAGIANSIGTYDGTNTKSIYNVSTGSGTSTAENSTTYIVFIENDSGTSQKATIAIDVTNVTLTWTKTGSPAAGDIQLLIECLG